MSKIDRAVALADLRLEGNPFINENGKTFLRYDEIQIKRPADGLVSIVFLWNGQEMYTMTVDADLSKKEMIQLSGITGRMQIKVI